MNQKPMNERSHDIIQLIINYLHITQLHSFFLIHELNFHMGFFFRSDKNPSIGQMKIIINTLQSFPNITITGIGLNQVKSINEFPLHICTNKLAHVVLMNFVDKLIARNLVNEHTKSITIVNVSNLTIIFAITNLKNLTSLTIKNSLEIYLDALKNHPKLKHLKAFPYIWSPQLLESLKNLRTCSLHDPKNILNGLQHKKLHTIKLHTTWDTFPNVQGCTNLRTIITKNCFRLYTAKLQQNHKLTKLDLSNTPISTLLLPTSLHTLILSNCNNINNLSFLSNCSNLRTLDLSHYRCEMSLIIPSPYLRTLKLAKCYRLTSIHAPFPNNLRILDLSWCKNLTNIQFLKSSPLLESLNLNTCLALSDISVLLNCPNIHTIDISQNRMGNAASVLSQLKNLVHLRAYNCRKSISKKLINPINF